MTASILSRWTSGPSNRALLATFQGEASVLRKVSARDTQGGYHDTFNSIGTFPCTFSRLIARPREVEFAVRVQDVTYWSFHFLKNAVDIQATDRLLTSTGRTFEVIGRGEGSSNTYLEIICLEIL